MKCLHSTCTGMHSATGPAKDNPRDVSQDDCNCICTFTPSRNLPVKFFSEKS